MDLRTRLKNWGSLGLALLVLILALAIVVLFVDWTR